MIIPMDRHKAAAVHFPASLGIGAEGEAGGGSSGALYRAGVGDGGGFAAAITGGLSKTTAALGNASSTLMEGGSLGTHMMLSPLLSAAALQPCWARGLQDALRHGFKRQGQSFA